jgi:hypothetical protein
MPKCSIMGARKTSGKTAILLQHWLQWIERHHDLVRPFYAPKAMVPQDSKEAAGNNNGWSLVREVRPFESIEDPHLSNTSNIPSHVAKVADQAVRPDLLKTQPVSPGVAALLTRKTNGLDIMALAGPVDRSDPPVG